MKAAQGEIGRVFVLRLEDGDRLPDSLEEFAAENKVRSAFCALVGGAGQGKVVVGPRDGNSDTIEPMLAHLSQVHEAAAVGTIFPDAGGRPKLHMHAALGRGQSALCGCVRTGVDIWRIAEVVMIELKDLAMSRKIDPTFGFEILTTD